jgi:glycosyltransferase involved in cell wall biosynthesis
MAQTSSTPVKTLFFHIMKGNFSGAQKNIFRLLRRIDSDKLTPVLLGQDESDLTALVRENGMDVVIIPFPDSLEVYDQKLLKFNVGQMIRTFVGFWKYTRVLVKEFRTLKPDVIWCDNVRTFFTLYLACKRVRAKVIWNIWSEPKGKVAWLLHRVALILADEINLEYANQAHTVLGRFAKVGFFKRKITPIYTGVTDFEPLTGIDVRDELSLSQEDILITMASNIVSGKGQLDLLKALEILSSDFPNLHLLVAGSPVLGHSEAFDYYERLKAYASDEHIVDHVHLLGWRSDIRDIYHASDIYVSSSYSESLPDAIRDAMNEGLPVVVTNVGGTRELVEVGENGYLFEPGDVEALVGYLRKIIEDSELRCAMGVKGKRIIDERFSTEVYVRNFEKMVLDLV